ncbi:hypothetical protein, partial [Nocardia sp. NPDC058497]|uniref:hypothetical protein n=1 Tax=Nocardia sp. NPDC058497 TaxID=3346529 RepID=UPI0036602335
MHTIDLDSGASQEISRFVTSAADRIPSRLDMRLADEALGRGEGLLPVLTDSINEFPARGVLVKGLPRFDDVERTKILTLLVADAVGRLTAYADYNASILTDIRPNPGSNEQNAQPQRLGMHNDFPFIADGVRPCFIILTTHIAEGAVPKTLLAPANEIVAALDADTIECLQQLRYSAVVGAKLAWAQSKRYTFPLMIRQGQR